MPIYEIALCDTEVGYSKKAKKTIEEYLDNISKKFRVLVYNKPKELLRDIKIKKISPIMLYIDVELDNQSGIEVVRRVNELSKECRVVYLSKHLKNVTEIYKTNHFYFVKKGELEERLPLIFDKYKNEIVKNDKYIGIPVKNNKYVFIKQNEILFFEREGRYTNINTIKDVYKTKYKLSEIEELLGKRQFVRCHNSYIISLNNIKEYKRDRITIKDYKVPVSRHYQVLVREKFRKYVDNKKSE